MNRSLSLATTLFLFLGMFALPLAPQAQGPEPSQGQKLFEARCASCHGLDAKGSLETAKALKVDPLRLDLTRSSIARRSHSSLRRLVGGGHGKMPKQESLTPPEIRALVEYLKGLQKAFVLAH